VTPGAGSILKMLAYVGRYVRLSVDEMDSAHYFENLLSQSFVYYILIGLGVEITNDFGFSHAGYAY